jgi:hypothetical protein
MDIDGTTTALFDQMNAVRAVADNLADMLTRAVFLTKSDELDAAEALARYRETRGL